MSRNDEEAGRRRPGELEAQVLQVLSTADVALAPGEVRDRLDPSGALWFRQTNSGESEYMGVELETMWRAGDSFSLDAALGYIHHELTDPGVANTCISFQNGDPCYSTRTPECSRSAG